MSWKWPLTALMQGAERVEFNRSNQPGIRDLESIRDEFVKWKTYYETDAKKHRERTAKLELIGDSQASWERRSRDIAEANAVRCDVGIRVMNWAITEIRAARP